MKRARSSVSQFVRGKRRRKPLPATQVSERQWKRKAVSGQAYYLTAPVLPPRPPRRPSSDLFPSQAWNGLGGGA